MPLRILPLVMKVADVMSRQVEYVSPQATVREVSKIIFGRGINGVPIVKNKKVVGFVTERDILSKFLPSEREYIEDSIKEGNFEAMEKKISSIFALKINKVMSKKVTVVLENEPLLKAQSLMFLKKIGRLPVIDKNKNMVGIITKRDIFRSLVGDKLELSDSEEYDDWFSKHYILYTDWKKRLSLEIPDLVKVFEKRRVKTVLDVGCGAGEHAIALSQKGFEVYAFDRSELMIREAKKRASKLSPVLKKRLFFASGELEDLTKNLNKKFDAVIFMGNSLGHNPHNYKNVLNSVLKILNPKATIIMQIVNFEKILKKDNRISQFRFQKQEHNKEHLFFSFYNLPKKQDDIILKTSSVFDFNGKVWAHYGLRSHVLANLKKAKIESLFKKLGFKNVFSYGSVFNNGGWDNLFKKEYKSLESDFINLIATRE